MNLHLSHAVLLELGIQASTNFLSNIRPRCVVMFTSDYLHTMRTELKQIHMEMDEYDE